MSRVSLCKLRNVSKNGACRLVSVGRFSEANEFRLERIRSSSFAFSHVRRDTELRFFSSPLRNDNHDEIQKTLEEQYTKKTPLEHVLLRPGMYVGPVERLPPNHCWVLEPTPTPPPPLAGRTPVANSYRMIHKEYGLIPALIKIFDEILVNASDNRLRYPKSCSRLDVIIDPGSTERDPFIQIWNDGKGIPVEVSCPCLPVTVLQILVDYDFLSSKTLLDRFIGRRTCIFQKCFLVTF